MGKTVTTYLIHGTPQGPRYVFLSNKDCKMYVIPRDNVSILTEREELQTPSLYILLGENEDGEREAYIGQTENFKERVRSHLVNKKFWDTALVFISQNQAMTKSDVLYLEYMSIDLACKKGSFIMKENKQSTKEPHLQEHQIDTVKEFFKDIQFLAAFIGCGVFEEGVKPIRIKSKNKEQQFFIKENDYGTDATLVKRGEKYYVLKGSVICPDVADYSKPSEIKKRSELIEKFVNSQNGKLFVKEDICFDSPSGAAVFVRGRASNGWVRWKDNNGKEIDKYYRNQE